MTGVEIARNYDFIILCSTEKFSCYEINIWIFVDVIDPYDIVFGRDCDSQNLISVFTIRGLLIIDDGSVFLTRFASPCLPSACGRRKD